MGRPKRHRLGQNFLVDGDVAERIVALLAEDPPRVLEVGPGRGALTEPLVQRFDRVMALEIDPNLADGPRSVILQQVTNGVAVRMAVLFLVSGGTPPEPLGTNEVLVSAHPAGR